MSIALRTSTSSRLYLCTVALLCLCAITIAFTFKFTNEYHTIELMYALQLNETITYCGINEIRDLKNGFWADNDAIGVPFWNYDPRDTAIAMLVRNNYRCFTHNNSVAAMKAQKIYSFNNSCQHRSQQLITNGILPPNISIAFIGNSHTRQLFQSLIARARIGNQLNLSSRYAFRCHPYSNCTFAAGTTQKWASDGLVSYSFNNGATIHLIANVCVQLLPASAMVNQMLKLWGIAAADIDIVVMNGGNSRREFFLKHIKCRITLPSIASNRMDINQVYQSLVENGFRSDALFLAMPTLVSGRFTTADNFTDGITLWNPSQMFSDKMSYCSAPNCSLWKHGHPCMPGPTDSISQMLIDTSYEIFEQQQL